MTRRILHTMLRVGDIDRSVDFYTRVLGMRVLRTLDQPSEKYSLSFLGYAGEDEAAVIELTYNYGIRGYQMGDAFGHIAISVDDCERACAEIKECKGNITLAPTALKGSNEIIAFVCDPDGYRIELIQRSPPPVPGRLVEE